MSDKSIAGGAEAADVVTNDTADLGDDQQNVSTSDNQGSFDYSKMVGNDGMFADNWKDALPEDLRNEPSLNNIKHITTLAKSYVSAQKMVGQNKIALPGEHATQTELDDFYTKLGRPAKAEDYSVEGINLPEGMSIDENQMKNFREFAFANGVSDKLFAKAVEYDIQRAKAAMEKQQAERDAEYDATLARLQSDGNMQTVVAQCNKALQTFNLENVFAKAGLLNNYELITAMAKIGASISESRLVSGEQKADVNSPDSRLREILDNFDDPYYHRDHPAHDRRVQEVRMLLDKKAAAGIK